MYALKCGKLFWCASNRIYKEGWSYMDGHISSSGIYTTSDKEEARQTCKYLRKKYSVYSTIRLVDISQDKKLSNLTLARLKYDNRI